MFERQNVLITGGSKGLGSALSMELARRGARVVVVARNGRAVAKTVEHIRATGGEAHGIEGDLGSAEDATRIAIEAAARVGPIDVLIHNASTLGPTPLRPLADLEPEEVARVFEVNVLGPFRLSRAVIGSMILRGHGLIVGISSDAAIEAYPGWGPYGASKAGLDHLLKIWAAELGERGVRVVMFDPGEMATDMHRAAIPDADPASLEDPAHVASTIVRVLEEGRAHGIRIRVPTLLHTAHKTDEQAHEDVRS